MHVCVDISHAIIDRMLSRLSLKHTHTTHTHTRPAKRHTLHNCHTLHYTCAELLERERTVCVAIGPREELSYLDERESEINKPSLTLKATQQPRRILQHRPQSQFCLLKDICSTCGL
jgi:hypothetical protein